MGIQHKGDIGGKSSISKENATTDMLHNMTVTCVHASGASSQLSSPRWSTHANDIICAPVHCGNLEASVGTTLASVFGIDGTTASGDGLVQASGSDEKASITCPLDGFQDTCKV